MRSPGPWIAFLTTLFVLVGLCGLFASYALPLPLERAMARGAMLDEVAGAADPAAEVTRLRPMLGSLLPVLEGTEPYPARVKAARAVVAEEQGRESASLGHRIRLMLVVVTVLAAAMGAGILALARKGSGA